MTFLSLPYVQVPIPTHINMVPSILRARKVNLAISKPITPPETIRFLPDESPYKGERLSRDNLIPSDGYSSLFTSGLNGVPTPTPPTSTKASLPISKPALAPRTPRTVPSAFTRPQLRPTTSPVRRRSSILNTAPTSPAKYKAPSAEIALENGMRQLKVAYTPSPHKEQSRWSMSSEETVETVPRRSGESVRSKLSGVVSLRSRKSEEKHRPGMEELMDIDPVPPVPKMTRPVTPSRLAKLRNMLTPKKKQSMAPSYPLPAIPAEPMFARPPITPSRYGLPKPPKDRSIPKKGSFATIAKEAQIFSRTPTTPAVPRPAMDLPMPQKSSFNTETSHQQPTPSCFGLPQPPFERSIPKKGSFASFKSVVKKESNPYGLPQPQSDRSVGKKGSFASLKSRAKKGSSTTLRGLFREEPMPDLPPTTPSKQYLRPAKSSIGPPTAQPVPSPSVFLNEMPRQAPITPRKGSDSVLADFMDFDFRDLPDMSFSTTPGTGTPGVYTPGVKPQKDRTKNRILPYTDRIYQTLQSEITPRSSASSSKRSIKSGKETWHSGPQSIYGRFQAQIALGTPAPLPPSHSVEENEQSIEMDGSTFGRRSQVDFTASPSRGKRMKKMSDVSIDSSISGEGTEDWELERFLREVENKEHMARQSGRF